MFLGQQTLKFGLLGLKNLDFDFPIIIATFDDKKDYKQMIHNFFLHSLTFNWSINF